MGPNNEGFDPRKPDSEELDTAGADRVTFSFVTFAPRGGNGEKLEGAEPGKTVSDFVCLSAIIVESSRNALTQRRTLLQQRFSKW